MASVPAATRTVREIWRSQLADGPAAVLAIGTTNPANCVSQDEFPDFYFRATNSDHLTAVKDKFKRVCKHATQSFIPASLIILSIPLHHFSYQYIAHRWLD